MKLASIDIGTNSILLLIAKFVGKQLLPILNRAEITRLGKDVDKSGKLDSSAMERTYNVLQHYSELCRTHEVTHVMVGGTSALRDASNGNAFIEKVQDNLGWNIRILSGDEEARLTFLASQKEFSDLKTNYLLTDIGGGSTEFIYGDQKQVHYFKSLDMGSVRFTEKFLHTDPPLTSELKESKQVILNELDAQLSDLRPDIHKTILIGVAGTVTTLLTVEKEMTEYIPDEIHKSIITREQVDDVLTLFCSLPLDKRKKLAGLHPKRADVIIMGILIVREIMHYFHFDKIHISDKGVRYGLLYEFLERNKNTFNWE